MSALRVAVAVIALTAGTASAATRASDAVVSPTQEIALLHVRHDAHTKPNAASPSVGSVSATTPITDGGAVLPVLGTYRQWVLVRLPGRPNGHTGWITRKGATLAVTQWHVVIDTSGRTVRAYRLGHLVRSFSAVMGKPSTPTPTGESFVEESIAIGADDVGAPAALMLSIRSNVYQHFEGGPGQIAMHGISNVGGVPGTAVSHGCVRLATASISWLAGHIGPGTPVTITS